MTIQFRPAQPDDAEAAINLIYSSGPDAFNYVFQTRSRGGAVDFLRYAFKDGAGEFGCRNHVVGIEGGQIVAAGAAWSGKSALPFMLAAARQILTHYGPVCGLQVIFRGLRTEAVIAPPGSKQFYIGHLGVSSALQSQGIGRQLIAYLLELGRARGFSVATLDVAETNPRGQALYERLGFNVIKVRESQLRNRFGFVPTAHNMQMMLRLR